MGGVDKRQERNQHKLLARWLKRLPAQRFWARARPEHQRTNDEMMYDEQGGGQQEGKEGERESIQYNSIGFIYVLISHCSFVKHEGTHPPREMFGTSV